MGKTVEGRPVERCALPGGHTLYLAETTALACAEYPAIADELNLHFGACEFIGLVNWHTGNNAPPRIFCAHSTADIPTGIFGPTSGAHLRAVLMAMEAERASVGLNEWRVLYEASHWSGPGYGRPAAELGAVRVPVFDIEIGSFADEWADPRAHEVMAKGLARVFEFVDDSAPRALFLGGTHFEPSATEATITGIAIEHHLPNQWLVSGNYGEPGAEERVVAAAKSCRRPPQLIVYHDGLKGMYKDCARRAAALLSIPCLSHRKLRTIEWRTLLGSAPTTAVVG